MKFSVMLLMLLAPLLIGSGDNRSDQELHTIESAKLVALLFDTGRVVVGEFQEVINDKSKGNKGFTPDIFAQRVIRKFEKETKLSWGNLAEESIPSQAKRLLPVLLETQKSIIQERQTLINLKGVGFKGFIQPHSAQRQRCDFAACLRSISNKQPPLSGIHEIPLINMNSRS